MEEIRLISKKKTEELYSDVSNTIMDARIQIKLYMDKNNLSKHYDAIDDIMFKCESKASKKAIDLFIKPKK